MFIEQVNDGLIQLGIAVFGLSALWMAMGNSRTQRRLALIVGLVGQAFWIAFAWRTQAWGIAALVAAYTAVYLRGAQVQWSNPADELLEGRNSQHVLKAERASADATDRENCAKASPDGGPMGAGQAAAAAPFGEDIELLLAEAHDALGAASFLQGEAWDDELCEQVNGVQKRIRIALDLEPADDVHPVFAPTGEVIELDYERCLVVVRLDADIPPFMEVKQRFALEPEAASGVTTSDRETFPPKCPMPSGSAD